MNPMDATTQITRRLGEEIARATERVILQHGQDAVRDIADMPLSGRRWVVFHDGDAVEISWTVDLE